MEGFLFGDAVGTQEFMVAATAGRCLCGDVAAPKLICFDCDSTLSALEGIDELARRRGQAVLDEVEKMTSEAMEGRVSLESVFKRRLEIIRPSREDVKAVGELYLATVEPTAQKTIFQLAANGWTPVIVSGGFTPAIQPLAKFLGIRRIEAVGLDWNPDGSYRGYDTSFPTTRSNGKAEVIDRLQRELSPVYTVMVGDGVSDLETKPMVDRFIGYGGYVARAKVKAAAGTFITSLAELTLLL